MPPEKTPNNAPEITTRILPKNTVLCREHDTDSDLYLIIKGKLLICVCKGSQVTPLAYLGEGEFLGELSFFDQEPRSANVIAVEESEIYQVPIADIHLYFPDWLLMTGRFLAKEIRRTDSVINEAGIKKRSVAKQITPLSVAEQTHYFNLIKNKTLSK